MIVSAPSTKTEPACKFQLGSYVRNDFQKICSLRPKKQGEFGGYRLQVLSYRARTVHYRSACVAPYITEYIPSDIHPAYILHSIWSGNSHDKWGIFRPSTQAFLLRAEVLTACVNKKPSGQVIQNHTHTPSTSGSSATFITFL